MPYQLPAAAGFDPDKLESAWLGLVRGAATGAFGGAVALIARRGEVVLHRATGWAVRGPVDQRSPMGTDAIFDLASLTKVVATLPSVLRLVAAGAVELDQPVGDILPEFGAKGAKREVTIRRLLGHSAGLTAWRAYYLDGTGPDAYLAAIAGDEPSLPPGEQVVYSDAGFILLGEIVRRVTGEPLAAYAAREVFAPIGMSDTAFLPPASWRSRIAATEIGNPFEATKLGERAASFGDWRQGLIRGDVHDGNAYYGLGGIAGHAGLFGSAPDLFRYGQLWLHGGEWADRRLIAPALVAAATREQAPGRGLGWSLAPVGADISDEHSGRGLGPDAFGHTGFTGTSLWIEPTRELVIVLLTNRVHPEVRDDLMTIRSSFTAAVSDSVIA